VGIVGPLDHRVEEGARTDEERPAILRHRRLAPESAKGFDEYRRR
jgi:hypothetical protein